MDDSAALLRDAFLARLRDPAVRARAYTAAYLAEFFEVPEPTIRWWVQQGWLATAGKRGKAHLYRLGDVADMKKGACPVSRPGGQAVPTGVPSGTGRGSVSRN